jgi:hypothetical protein
LSVGGAEASQNGLGDLDADEIVREDQPWLLPEDQRSACPDDLGRVAPWATAVTVRSSPPATQSPPAQIPARGAPLGIDLDAAADQAEPTAERGWKVWPMALNT